jgi:hypothetical protein
MIFGEAASQVSADIAQYWLLNVACRTLFWKNQEVL